MTQIVFWVLVGAWIALEHASGDQYGVYRARTRAIIPGLL